MGLLIFIRILTFIPENKLAALAYALHRSCTADNPTLAGQNLCVGFDLGLFRWRTSVAPAEPRAQNASPTGVQEPASVQELTSVLLEQDYTVLSGCKERSHQQPAPQKQDAENFKALLGRSQPGSDLWLRSLTVPRGADSPGKHQRKGREKGNKHGATFVLCYLSWWLGGLRDSSAVALSWYDLHRGALRRSPAVGLSPALALEKWIYSPAWGQASAGEHCCMYEGEAV